MGGKAVLDSWGHPGVGCVAAATVLVSPSAWGQVVAEIWGSPGVEFGAGGDPCAAAFVGRGSRGCRWQRCHCRGGVRGVALPPDLSPPHPLVSVEQPLTGSILLPQHIPAISAAASRSSRPPAVPSPGACARSEPSICHLRVTVALLPAPSPQANSRVPHPGHFSIT